jgi:hypothetical protein
MGVMLKEQAKSETRAVFRSSRVAVEMCAPREAADLSTGVGPSLGSKPEVQVERGNVNARAGT